MSPTRAVELQKLDDVTITFNQPVTIVSQSTLTTVALKWDTWLDSVLHTTNYHSANYWGMEGGTTYNHSLLAVDVPSGDPVSQCVLSFFVDVYNGPLNCRAYLVDHTKTPAEDQATWDIYATGHAWTTGGGDVEATPYVDFTISVAGWVTVDITTLVAAAVALGMSTFYLLLVGLTSGKSVLVLSNDGGPAEHRPSLAWTQTDDELDSAKWSAIVRDNLVANKPYERYGIDAVTVSGRTATLELGDPVPLTAGAGPASVTFTGLDNQFVGGGKIVKAFSCPVTETVVIPVSATQTAMLTPVVITFNEPAANTEAFVGTDFDLVITDYYTGDIDLPNSYYTPESAVLSNGGLSLTITPGERQRSAPADIPTRVDYSGLDASFTDTWTRAIGGFSFGPIALTFPDAICGNSLLCGQTLCGQLAV